MHIFAPCTWLAEVIELVVEVREVLLQRLFTFVMRAAMEARIGRMTPGGVLQILVDVALLADSARESLNTVLRVMLPRITHPALHFREVALLVLLALLALIQFAYHAMTFELRVLAVTRESVAEESLDDARTRR